MGGPAYWVLPVAVLVLRPLGLIAQVVRGSMISALSSAYVKTAKAKGARRTGIIFVHALRRSEEHTSELQSLMRISYAVFCLKKKKKKKKNTHNKSETY